MFSVQSLDENISIFKAVRELFKRIYKPSCANLSVTLKRIRNSIDRRTHLVLYKECTFSSLITTKLMKSNHNVAVAGVLVLQNSTTNIYEAYGVTNSLEIKHLIVAPEFRSLGLGSALLTKAVFEARQCSHALSLHFLISEGAITGTTNFLLAHGFHQSSLIGHCEDKTLFSLDIRQNILPTPSMPSLLPPVDNTSHSFSTPPLNTEKVIPLPAATAPRKISKILPATRERNRKSKSLFSQNHQETQDNNNNFQTSVESILPASKRHCCYRNQIYAIINCRSISNQSSSSTSPNVNLHSKLIYRLLQLRKFPLSHRITTSTKFQNLFSSPPTIEMTDLSKQQLQYESMKGMLNIGLMRNIREKDFILWIMKDKEDLVTSYQHNNNNEDNNKKSIYCLTRVVNISFEFMPRSSSTSESTTTTTTTTTTTITQGDNGMECDTNETGESTNSICRLIVDRVLDDELRLLLLNCSTRKTRTSSLE